MAGLGTKDPNVAYFGQSSIPHGDSLAKLRDRYGIPILAHRDRDFMSDSDLDAREDKKGFVKNEIPTWFPDGPDIESYFCERARIAEGLKVLDPVAERIIDKAIQSFDEQESGMAFETALSRATNFLPASQGSSLGARWMQLGEFGARTIKGKVLLKAIEQALRLEFVENAEARRLALLPRLREPSRGLELEKSLKVEIEQLIR